MAEKISAHTWSIEQTAKDLSTDLTNGLTNAEARARLEKYGPNELKEKPRPGFLSLLLDQFKDFLIIILIAAAVLSVLLGEWIDAIVILAIVALNSVIGVVQESKAETSLVLVMAVIFLPFLNTIFGTVPLAAIDWLWIIPFSLLASIAAEVTKIYLRARAKKIDTSLQAQMELA